MFGAVALLLLVLELINGRFWLNDFRVYYDSARSLLHGDPLYGVAHGLDSGIFKYAPVMAMLYVPLALLPYGVAATIQYLLITAAFIGASILADRLIRTHLLRGRAGSYAPLFLTVLVMVVHLHRELHLGNINVMLLCLLLWALERLVSGKRTVAGALIGLAIIAKPHFTILLPLLLVRREWKATLAAIAVPVIGVALPALFLGLQGNWELHRAWLGEMARHNASLIYTGGDNYTAVNTVYSFLHRTLLKHFLGGPTALEAMCILGVIAAGSGAFVLRNIMRGTPNGIVIEYLLLLALVPSLTLTDTEHFLFSLPVVAYVVFHLVPRADPRWAAIIAVPLLAGLGGNWEDALGPASEWMIHFGVLGMANVGLILWATFLYCRSNPERNGTSYP
ncbi:MAG: DUF2029 domain-containing protein [Flavobacteriales bacterium]|nr:DUF2029 domain-containing protein [Flavobacteriales bacterium]